MRGSANKIGASVLGSGLLFLCVASAHALDGRYLLTFNQNESAGFSTTRLRHLLDLGTRQTTYRGYDVRLNATLSFENEPGEPGTSFFRSRFFGELRSQLWRLRGQFVPKQGTGPGDNVPTERNWNLGFDLTPRRAPHLRLFYQRFDRESFGQRSSNDDGRVEVSYAFRRLGVYGSARRLQSGPELGPISTTKELRGGANTSLFWRTTSLSGSYDVVRSSVASLERQRRQLVHRLNLGAGWRPTRKLTFGGAGFGRLGYSEDTITTSQDIEEYAFSLNARYMPVRDLSFEAIREYRRYQFALGPTTSDFLRLEALFRRALHQDLFFHAGARRTFDLATGGGGAPASTIFSSIDGRLREGLEGRAELRAARFERTGGTQWRELLQLRTYPLESTRFEVTWTGDQRPEVLGVRQRDSQWSFELGYQAFSGGNLSGSYRLLNGRGRIDRREKFFTVTATVHPSRATSLSGNWFHRRTEIPTLIATERNLGIDFSARLAREWRLQLAFRRLAGSVLPTARSFTGTLTYTF